MKYTIKNKNEQIPYFVENNILDNFSIYSKYIEAGSKALIVTDKNVNSLYIDTISQKLKNIFEHIDILIVPNKEKAKTINTANKIYNKLLELNFSRNDYIIAVGGGCVLDISGFVASTFMRGIKLINIPTTLLAQVDACLGGKTAINTTTAKNIIGSFYHPNLILIDPKYLASLPTREIQNGVAEIIKYGAIANEHLFDVMNNHNLDDFIYITKHNYFSNNYETTRTNALSNDKDFNLESIITRCLKIKAKLVSNDPTDKNSRMLLNFGHTIGHAIETIGNYKTYSHGEAVAIGMCMITRSQVIKRSINTIFMKESISLTNINNIINKIICKYELPTSSEFKSSEISSKIKYDKKCVNDDYINIVVLDKIGKAKIIKANIKYLI